MEEIWWAKLKVDLTIAVIITAVVIGIGLFVGLLVNIYYRNVRAKEKLIEEYYNQRIKKLEGQRYVWKNIDEILEVKEDEK